MDLLSGVIDERTRVVLIFTLQSLSAILIIISTFISVWIVRGVNVENKFRNFCASAWVNICESPFKDLVNTVIVSIYQLRNSFKILIYYLFNTKYVSIILRILYPIPLGLGAGIFFGYYWGILFLIFGLAIYFNKVKNQKLNATLLILYIFSSFSFIFIWMNLLLKLSLPWATFISIIIAPIFSYIFISYMFIGIFNIFERIYGVIGIWFTIIFAPVFSFPFVLLYMNMLVFIGFSMLLLCMPIAPFLGIKKISNLQKIATDKGQSIHKKITVFFTYNLQKIHLYFFSRSKNLPFNIEPGDNEENIQDRFYLFATPIASFKGIHDHMERMLKPTTISTILPLSIAVTFCALSLGHYIDPIFNISISFRLLFTNFIFDLISIMVTFRLIKWLFIHYSLANTIYIIILDFLLSGFFAFLSLYTIFLGTSEYMSVSQVLNLLVGKSIDGTKLLFGPYFWLMHTVFLPTIAFLIILLIAFIAHCLHKPFEWIAHYFGLSEKPLAYSAALTAFISALLSGLFLIV